MPYKQCTAGAHIFFRVKSVNTNIWTLHPFPCFSNTAVSHWMTICAIGPTISTCCKVPVKYCCEVFVCDFKPHTSVWCVKIYPEWLQVQLTTCWEQHWEAIMETFEKRLKTAMMFFCYIIEVRTQENQTLTVKRVPLNSRGFWEDCFVEQSPHCVHQLQVTILFVALLTPSSFIIESYVLTVSLCWQSNIFCFGHLSSIMHFRNPRQPAQLIFLSSWAAHLEQRSHFVLWSQIWCNKSFSHISLWMQQLWEQDCQQFAPRTCTGCLCVLLHGSLSWQKIQSREKNCPCDPPRWDLIQKQAHTFVPRLLNFSVWKYLVWNTSEDDEHSLQVAWADSAAGVFFFSFPRLQFHTWPQVQDLLCTDSISDTRLVTHGHDQNTHNHSNLSCYLVFDPFVWPAVWMTCPRDWTEWLDIDRHCFQGASRTILRVTLVDLQEIYQTTTQKMALVVTCRWGSKQPSFLKFFSVSTTELGCDWWTPDWNCLLFNCVIRVCSKVITTMIHFPFQIFSTCGGISCCWKSLSEAEVKSAPAVCNYSFSYGNLCVCGSILWKLLELLGHYGSAWFLWWLLGCG